MDGPSMMSPMSPLSNSEIIENSELENSKGAQDELL